MKKIFIHVVIWLFCINLFAIAVNNRLNLNEDSAHYWMGPGKFPVTKTWNPVEQRVFWDSEWYLDIAKNGYYLRENDQLHNIVFFPLYPMLIKVMSYLVLGNYLLAGWLVSIAALFGAIFYLYKLVKEFHPNVIPEEVIFFALVFPTAIFFNAIYTESLFLFLSIATFYYPFKKQFWLAGLLGLLASLTRISGVFLFIPLVYELLRQDGFKELFKSKPYPFLLIPLGTLSFFAFHYLRFGDFLLFMKIEANWGRDFNPFKLYLNSPEEFKNFVLTPASYVHFSLDVLFIVFIFIITYLVYKNLSKTYGIYMFLTAIVPLSTGTMMSIGRYILILFPIYIFAASIKNEYVKNTWAFASVLLLAFYTMLYANNYWAG